MRNGAPDKTLMEFRCARNDGERRPHLDERHLPRQRGLG